MVSLFSLREGELSFYHDAMPKQGVAPVTLAVGPLIEEGVAATLSDDRAEQRRLLWRGPFVALDVLGPLREAGWSSSVETILERVRSPVDPSALVDAMGGDPVSVIRAIESARVARLVGTLVDASAP